MIISDIKLDAAMPYMPLFLCDDRREMGGVTSTWVCVQKFILSAHPVQCMQFSLDLSSIKPFAPSQHTQSVSNFHRSILHGCQTLGSDWLLCQENINTWRIQLPLCVYIPISLFLSFIPLTNACVHTQKTFYWSAKHPVDNLSYVQDLYSSSCCTL